MAWQDTPSSWWRFRHQPRTWGRCMTRRVGRPCRWHAPAGAGPSATTLPRGSTGLRPPRGTLVKGLLTSPSKGTIGATRARIASAPRLPSEAGGRGKPPRELRADSETRRATRDRRRGGRTGREPTPSIRPSLDPQKREERHDLLSRAHIAPRGIVKGGQPQVDGISLIGRERRQGALFLLSLGPPPSPASSAPRPGRRPRS